MDRTTDTTLSQGPFGSALEGDVVAIGSPGVNYAGMYGINAGDVFVFTRSIVTGSGYRMRNHPTGLVQGGSQHGFSVAIYNGNVAAGAPDTDYNGYSSAGSVFVYSAVACPPPSLASNTTGHCVECPLTTDRVLGWPCQCPARTFRSTDECLACPSNSQGYRSQVQITLVPASAMRAHMLRVMSAFRALVFVSVPLQRQRIRAAASSLQQL